MWQVSSGFNGAYLAIVIVLLVAVGTTFLWTRLPGEIGRLAAFAEVAEVHALCAGTPAEPASHLVDGPTTAGDLSRRQRGNVLLVALFSQGLQVVLVGAVLGAFFVVFGVLTITPEVTEAWLGSTGDVLLDLELFGRDAVVTAELLKLSAFLASFSALYFAVTLVTDDTYRREFFDEIVGELRQTFAVRAAYLALRVQSGVT
jgi:hypothetical protein